MRTAPAGTLFLSFLQLPGAGWLPGLRFLYQMRHLPAGGICLGGTLTPDPPLLPPPMLMVSESIAPAKTGADAPIKAVILAAKNHFRMLIVSSMKPWLFILDEELQFFSRYRESIISGVIGLTLQS